MKVLHRKHSNAPDSSDPNKINASDWNDSHIILGGLNPIDMPPDAPDSMNDEFDGPGLNPLWIEMKNSNFTSRVKNGAYDIFKTNPDAATPSIRFSGLAMPINMIPGSYVACIERAGSDYAYAGVTVGFGNRVSSRFANTVISYHQSYGGTDSTYSFTSSAPATSDAYNTIINHAQIWSSRRLYVKFEVDSTQCTIYLSTNGRIFTKVSTFVYANWLLAVDCLLIGLHPYPYAGEVQKGMAMSILWFRKGDEDTVHGY